MNEQGAKRWLVISALVVAGVWGYRRWQEGPAAVQELPKFFTAWGVTYFVLALISEASPRFGGSFSVLVMTADILSQGAPLVDDVTKNLQGIGAKGTTSSGPAAARSGTLPGSVQTGKPRPAPAHKPIIAQGNINAAP